MNPEMWLQVVGSVARQSSSTTCEKNVHCGADVNVKPFLGSKLTLPSFLFRVKTKSIKRCQMFIQVNQLQYTKLSRNQYLRKINSYLQIK